MIIDSHSHYMPKEVLESVLFYSKDWADIDSQLRFMDSTGIEQAVLNFPTVEFSKASKLTESEFVDLYNDEISKEVKKHPDRFIGVGILPLLDLKRSVAQVNKIVDKGLKAISMPSSVSGVYLNDLKFVPVFHKIQAHGLPVFVHATISNPIGIERVRDPLLSPVIEYVFDLTMSLGRLMMSGALRDFKDIKFVFAHFAGVLPFIKDRFDTTYSMLLKRNYVADIGKLPSEYFKNIYVDTSGVSNINMINLAIDTFGTGNILWGSDYPANKNGASSLNMVKFLNISGDEKAGMLGMNVAKLIK